ncbi:hypothetical protein GR160_18710 [Flavobacterium sp. Sd200]|uniref:hypothetical protein n=1 Tax=Flavobacterium sp. Sd200 TaxID=2692211 RepID=UPI00136C53E4|nr:hypothetical protein [Flavobacterium sp. Sd200]MXN93264.1 hypothetical protein [Flavobacterium sp. Sd200]
MLNVKTIKKTALPFCGIMLLALTVACNNDDASSLSAITQEDAAEAISASVTSQTNGLAKTMTDASALAATEAVYTTNANLDCNRQYTGSYNAAASQSVYTYNYSGSRNYTLHCLDNEPSEFQYNTALQGTYDTPRMYSNDSSESALTISGLSPTQTLAVFNGSYVRNGYQESKIRQRRNFNSVLTYTVNAITVNKSTRQIQSGTASVTFAGTGSGGNSYNYSGSITFNTNNTATLTLNGTIYTINL